jgi:hypothetical protein
MGADMTNKTTRAIAQMAEMLLVSREIEEPSLSEITSAVREVQEAHFPRADIVSTINAGLQLAGERGFLRVLQ